MHRYGLWRSSTIPSLESERDSQTPERAGSGSIPEPLTRFSAGPSRSVPGYACPFTEHSERIQKRARPQSAHERFRLHANTRLVGVAAFSGISRGLKLVLAKWHCLVPPTSG